MTCPHHVVLSIERVHDDAKRLNYGMLLRKMEGRSDGVGANQQFLWHGTSTEVVDQIVANGFNRSFSVTAAYGNGVYFARDASYSAGGYAKPDPLRGNAMPMIFARVLLGRAATGLSGMVTPPSVENGPPTLLHDSLVDNLENPSVVVSCHNDNQAFPEYVAYFLNPGSPVCLRSRRGYEASQALGRAGRAGQNFDLAVRKGWQSHQLVAGAGVISMGLYKGAGDPAWGSWRIEQHGNGSVRLLHNSSAAPPGTTLCLAVKDNWNELTAGGEATKFDCFELLDASTAKAKGKAGRWLIEMPPAPIANGGAAAAAGGGSSAGAWLCLMSVQAKSYLHVRKSWQKLAGNMTTRGHCFMLLKNPTDVGSMWYITT